MKKNSKKSTNCPRERPLRPSPDGLYLTDGKNIYYSKKVAKLLEEALKELEPLIREVNRREAQNLSKKRQ